MKQKKIFSIFFGCMICFLAQGILSAQSADRYSVNTRQQQYRVFQHKNTAEKETLFKNIHFVREVPQGALKQPESVVNDSLIQQGKKAKAKIIAGSLLHSSISNVAFARKSGFKVCLMTAKDINEVITGLILQPDYLVLDPALEPEKIKSILLDRRHNFSGKDPGYTVNYPIDSKRTENTDLRVMSYNILAQCWGGEMPPVSERAPMIARVIKSVAPDFAGLQELDPVWYNNLEDKIQPYRFARDPYKDMMCAIIYDSTKYKQIGGGVLPYTNKHIRCLRYTLLEDLKNGKKFLVTNTHWDLTTGKRLKNAELMIQYLKDLQGKYPGIPVICTGDFNCTFDQKEFQLLQTNSGFTDAAETAPFSENKMVASWISPRYAEIPHVNRKQIDHVLVSGKLHVLSARLLFSSHLLQISDHLPVVADLKFK